ncbi:MAG: ABC transporter substrate-binding protein [Ancalomicrobiaceae bacterium]|nr:ABC transporter substrate-binding protein [Ancalomicrobiaceae bacterium]
MKTARLAVATALCLLVAAGALPAAAQIAPDGTRGGILRLVSGAGGGTLDPHINYTTQYFQLNYILYDGLVTFRKADGKAGEEVVADLAERLPVISDGGRTLTFVLRDGVKFSNGKPVTVEDVAASLRRMFIVQSPTAGTFFTEIVGADKCMAQPQTCTLEGGVSVDAASRTVVIRLTAPDYEFLQKLSLPHAAILPADAPPKDAGAVPIPGTGPYMVVSHDPQKGLDLVRNPYFKEFSADAQPDGWVDEIIYDFGLTEEQQIAAVGAGKADWMFDTLPSERLPELAIKYARRLHVRPLPAMWYAAMNTNLPPFDDIRVRQAVNYAIDRYALVKLAGGPNLAVAACQILPPEFPGYQPYCPYTLNPGTKWSKPDLRKALSLVEASGTAGMKVAIVVKDAPTNRAIGENLAGTLRRLGYDASVKPVPKNIQSVYIQNTDNKVQMSVSMWSQDYPSASDFLKILFSCGSFHRSSGASINISGFCDHAIDARMAEALRLGANDPVQSAALWSEIDKAITDKAPVAVLFNPKEISFFSSRVRHFEFNDQMFWILSKSWLE